jgi:hypothetical protein
VCSVFDVEAVTAATTPCPEVSFKEGVEALLVRPPKLQRWDESPRPPRPKWPVEACSRYHGRLLEGVEFHPVVAAVQWAFDCHHPLILSPDVIWLMVAQGVANHVNANAEDLRPRFVKHAGKLTLVVERDDLVKGSPENPWPEVFREFTGQIRSHIGEETHDLLQPTFSTTGETEKAASQVVLLDAMQSYFNYRLMTKCGIPWIALEGTPDDWADLARRTSDLGRVGLEWWTEALAPILDEFAAAARGRVNTRFWKCLYKKGEIESGGPYVRGWITSFFPYLKDRSTGLATLKHEFDKTGLHRLLSPTETGDRDLSQCVGGLTTDRVPAGLARAPFLWEYLGTIFKMEFLGGFVGVQQDPITFALRPEIGWAVRDAPSPEDPEDLGDEDQDALAWAPPVPREVPTDEPPEQKVGPPCPFCGHPLQTSKAQQCFRCGMDWHDPDNPRRLGRPPRG